MAKEIIQKSVWDLMKVAAVIGTATCVGKFFTELLFPETNIVVIYMLAVLCASRLTSDYYWGILASVASLLCYNYFFTAPYHTLAVNDPSYLITFTIMLITAFVTSALTIRAKLLTKEAQEKAMESNILYMLSKRLSDAADIKEIISVAVDSIQRVLQEDAGCLYFSGDGQDLCVWRIGDVETHRKTADSLEIRKRLSSTHTECYESSQYYNYGIYGHGGLLGAVQIPKNIPKEKIYEKENLLYSILENVAMALERIRIINARIKDREEMEQERYRANLLRSISHDLRTPLSGIIGTSEVLLDLTEEEDRRYTMIQGIYQDADWLHSLVENILSLTRLQDGRIHVHKELEAMEEVAACAVEHVEKVFSGREVQVNLPDSFHLVPMDARLIQQVITNLLDNALKHTKEKEKIELDIQYGTDMVQVTVKDEGEGLDIQDEPNIFQMFYTSKTRATDVKKGIGLGLTICETIVKAHGGKIEGRNRTDGKGSEFTFWLPMEDRNGDV